MLAGCVDVAVDVVEVVDEGQGSPESAFVGGEVVGEGFGG